MRVFSFRLCIPFVSFFFYSHIFFVYVINYVRLYRLSYDKLLAYFLYNDLLSLFYIASLIPFNWFISLFFIISESTCFLYVLLYQLLIIFIVSPFHSLLMYLDNGRKERDTTIVIFFERVMKKQKTRFSSNCLRFIQY